MAEPSSSPRTQKFRGVPSFRYQPAEGGRPAPVGESPPTLPASTMFDPVRFGRQLQDERENEEREEDAALAEYEQAHRSRPLSGLPSEAMPPQVEAALAAELGRREAERQASVRPASARAPSARLPSVPEPPRVPTALPPPVATVPAAPVTQRSRAMGSTANKPPSSYKARRRSCTAEIAQEALAEHAGNKSRAARAMGITRQGLYKILSRRA